MGQLDLTIVVSEQECLGALQHSQFPSLETRCMVTGPDATTTRLDARHLYLLILQKRPEETDGIAAAPHTSNEEIRQAPHGFTPGAVDRARRGGGP